jgi:hypothetical protein
MNYFETKFEIPVSHFKELQTRCIIHCADFSNFISNGIEYPYKLIGTRNVVKKDLSVKWLYDQCRIQPTTDCFLLIPAFTNTGIHIDSKGERNTVLTFPLFPEIKKYQGTNFYNNDLTYNETCNFKSNCPVFLNTQVLHAVETLDTDRICFQLCFKEDICELVNLYNSGKFFI